MNLPVFTDPVTKEPSFSLSVAAMTFAIVMVKWMIGGVAILGHTFQAVTESEINTWLTPTLIFYLVRQGTKAAETVALARAPQSPANP